MIRIIHCVDFNKFGGIQTIVLQLVNYQATEKDIQPAIMFSKRLTDEKSKTIPDNIKKFESGLVSGYDWSISKFIKIRKIFSEYDIIHLHGFGVLIALAAVSSGKKIVYTEHGTFQKANQFNSLKNFIKKRMLGYFFLKNYADIVVFVSRWLKENVSLKSRRQCVIHNGIKCSAISSISNDIIDKFVILGVGRLVKKKRFDRLIKAIQKLNNDNRYFLEIIGDGPEKKSLQNLAEELLPQNRFIFHGFKPNVQDYYRKASALILTTKYEPFGLVILEAIINNTLVIVFKDCGGALEILGEYGSDLMASDENDLAAKIKYWCENFKERQIIVNKLKKRVIEKFNISIMSEEYLKVYNKILR